MDLTNKEHIVSQLPLFRDLAESQRALIAQKSTIASVNKDEFIYKEADPPSAFFCIISGRVVLSVTGKILEYLHRGQYFGIISLLTGEPHSVSAKAINDCILLRIEKEDFRGVLLDVAPLSIDLMQTLSRRLKNKDVHPKAIFESTILSIYSSYAQSGKTMYALNLALSLANETHKKILLIDVSSKDNPHRIPQKFENLAPTPSIDVSSPDAFGANAHEYIARAKAGIDIACVTYDQEKEDTIAKVVALLSHLVNDYHYIILYLPAGMDAAIFGILHQSDLVHVISSPDEVDLKRTSALIERLIVKHNFSVDKIKVIVNEYKIRRLSFEEEARLLQHPIYATLPQFEPGTPELIVLEKPQAEYARAVRRISRQVGDCLTGLALGVGAAYGLSHIGVLKVLEREHIPIDMLSGSSIGALIAAFWAAGFSADEIENIVTNEFKDENIFKQMVDLTFPRLGFIKGHKIHRMLHRHLGKKTFYDIRMPLKILACDVRGKRAIVIEKGSLVDAVLASCAMPGVFRPVRFKEELLVDGGILNPLPTEILVKNGVRKIIAVNVTPSREDILKQLESQAKQSDNVVKKYGLFGLKLYIKDMLKVTILDFIFGSIEIMQSEMAQRESQLADVLLHPDLTGLNWLEFHKARELVRRGETEAERNLAKILQLTKE